MKYFCGTGATREQWGLGQLKCTMAKMERYKMDAYHVRKHSRLAHVVFYVIFFSITSDSSSFAGVS